MSYLTGFRCHRCGRFYPPGRLFLGCPACAGDKPSNLIAEYDYEAIGKVFSRNALDHRPSTMWRYREFLPVDEEHIVSISEGFTPLVACPNLGRKLGLSALYVKDESRNPTWSFKDRMASAGVSSAVAMGCSVITAASSGNGGAAAAAYAARAGLDAVIVTTPQFPLTMRTLMQSYGAKVVATKTMRERWTIVRLGVEKYGWFPTQNFIDPPIGANPYALEGCKTMGYEICEQLEWRLPDYVVSPVGSGDSMAGIWQAFREWLDLRIAEPGSRMPRMVAAEVFGSLQDALARGLDHTEAMPTAPTVAVSVGVANSAYQSLRVLRETDGIAMTASDDEMLQMQSDLASDEGIYSEASSVLTLAVVKKMVARGVLKGHEVVVALLTSTGLKDPEATATRLRNIPVIEATEDDLARVLRDEYGMALSGAEASAPARS
ncbi:MAG TPA: pyridoxal-phosphate dependent enzyme [Candidatus Limnocylindria bacterium]|jgi:threonine synthase|nr:pyridoxal-phosphate dependent enzyme [Candidatus Limnocylindria bacterium]